MCSLFQVFIVDEQDIEKSEEKSVFVYQTVKLGFGPDDSKLLFGKPSVKYVKLFRILPNRTVVVRR